MRTTRGKEYDIKEATLDGVQSMSSLSVETGINIIADTMKKTDLDEDSQGDGTRPSILPTPAPTAASSPCVTSGSVFRARPRRLIVSESDEEQELMQTEEASRKATLETISRAHLSLSPPSSSDMACEDTSLLPEQSKSRVAISFEELKSSLDSDELDADAIDVNTKGVNKEKGKSSGQKKRFAVESDSGADSGTTKTGASTSRKKVKKAPRVPVSYTLNPDYLDETANAVIIGEDDAPGDEEENTLPLRTLDDFVIYNILDRRGKNRYKMTGLEDCHEEGFELRASGKVAPILVDGEEDIDQGIDNDEDNNSGEYSPREQFLNLSSLFYFEFGRDERTGTVIVWLRTESAFYKLVQPSPIYETIHEAFLKLGWNEGDGREFMEEEPEEQFEAQLEEFGSNEIATPPYEGISDTPTAKTKSKATTATTGPNAKSITATASRNSKKPGVQKGTAATSPCVTPLIASLAGDLFNRQLDIASHISDDAARALLANEQHLTLVEKEHELQAEWIGKPIGEYTGRVYYRAAEVEGMTLRAGDCVYVRNETPQPWLAKIMYFFEHDGEKHYHIRYFARGSETILMETAGAREVFLLDNCADNGMGTIISKCPLVFVRGDGNIPTDKYYYRYWYDSKLCAFEDATMHETIPEAAISELSLIEETLTRRISLEPCITCFRPLKAQLEATLPRKLQHGSETVQILQTDEVLYHEHDFVYLAYCDNVNGVMTPKVGESELIPFNIGQIVRILPPPSKKKEPQTVKIRLLERYDNFSQPSPKILSHADRIQKPVFKDCRRLVLTSITRLFAVSALHGTCRVKFVPESEDHDLEAQRALEEYKDQRDTYYYKDYLAPKLALPKDHGGEVEDLVAARRKRLVRISDKSTVNLNSKTFGIQLATPCAICVNHEQQLETKRKKLLSSVKKLRALDIFSGCGGLSSGLEDTGVVETKYAIEFMTSAAQTFRHNFPGAKVYNDDANILLSRAIDQHSSKPVPPRNDFAGESLPDMPAPGDVDMIYCGPPCQGFSRMNRYPKADDMKNSLVATSLSYVDFYKPKYFLLENVRGMVQFKLGKCAVDGRWTGGISMGVIKFIIRCLTAMGYQCRFGLFQAGNHGLPQSRTRFFIWGARLGAALPTFPLPSTCFGGLVRISPPSELQGHTPFTYQGGRGKQAPDPSVTVRDAIADLPGFEYINPHKEYEESKKEKKERLREEQWAFREAGRLKRRKRKQLQRMTEKYKAEFAESDMDGYPSTCDESEEEKEREEEEVAAAKEAESEERGSRGKLPLSPVRPYFMQVDGHAPTSGIGFTSHGKDDGDEAGGKRGKYRARPQSEFQRQMRAKVGTKYVLNHVVRPFNDINLERICRVPMEPEADHQSLPEKLKPWCLSSPDSKAQLHNNWKGLFGRLDFEGHFQTAVTEMQPMGKQGKVLHPNQHRVLSVREYARVQGFSDDFEFLSATNEIKCMYKQVGNAVPPPLARALGLKLQEAMMDSFE